MIKVSRGLGFWQAVSRKIHELTKLGKIKLICFSKQAKMNSRNPIMLICLKSHKKFKVQDTWTWAGLIIEFFPSNCSNDDGKIDVQTHKFEQAHIINTSVSKLLHVEGIEPCQLLMATDDVVIYRRHLHMHGVEARQRGLMLQRYEGWKLPRVEWHAITRRVRDWFVVRRGWWEKSLMHFWAAKGTGSTCGVDPWYRSMISRMRDPEDPGEESVDD
jgi:hypothetical protein